MKTYKIIPSIEGSQYPRITIKKNSEGKVVICLDDWNTKESEDGWSPSEIEELISSLNLSLKKAKQININENTDCLFSDVGDNMLEKPSRPKYTEEWVSRLIELSNESVYSYEKYLLDEIGYKELAVKMKALQKHILRYMGGTKNIEDTIE